MEKRKRLASDLEHGGALLAVVEPATGGIVSTIGNVLGKAFQAAERRKQTWWRHVVENKTEEEFEQTLEYELNEEHGDVILEGLRAALSTVDSAALPPLGRLTRLYLLTETGARDRFFRSCTRMLCDVSADEIDLIRRIVIWSLNVVAREEFHLVQRGSLVYVVKDEFQGEKEDKAGTHATIELNASRAFELFADYMVLRPTNVTYSGGTPPNIIANRTVFSKLRHVLTGYNGIEG
jgi:hypothetical protein